MATIHVITLVITKGLRKPEEVEDLTGPTLRLTYSILDNGPPSIESPTDELAAIPDTVKRALEAEGAGADGIIIDCVADPGVKEAQAVVKIPVFGPGSTTMLKAATYGLFSIVTVAAAVKPMFSRVAGECKVQDQLTSVRVLNVPVLELATRPDDVKKGLQEEALRTARGENAKAVMLGCTGFFRYAEGIEQFRIQGQRLLRCAAVFDPFPFTLFSSLRPSSMLDWPTSHSRP